VIMVQLVCLTLNEVRVAENFFFFIINDAVM